MCEKEVSGFGNLVSAGEKSQETHRFVTDRHDMAVAVKLIHYISVWQVRRDQYRSQCYSLKKFFRGLLDDASCQPW